MHSYPVAKKMKKWSPTENFPTDLEPFELSDEILDSFFAAENPKELQYYGCEGISSSKDPPGIRVPTEKCVRVNVKVNPTTRGSELLTV